MINAIPYFVVVMALLAAVALDPCVDEAARRIPARIRARRR